MSPKGSIAREVTSSPTLRLLYFSLAKYRVVLQLVIISVLYGDGG